jgi:hypothetical protein
MAKFGFPKGPPPKMKKGKAGKTVKVNPKGQVKIPKAGR